MFKTSQSYAAKIVGSIGILHLPETQSFRLKQAGGLLWQGQSFIPAATALELYCLAAELCRQPSLLCTVKVSVSIPLEKSTSGIVLSHAGGVCGVWKGPRKLLNLMSRASFLCKCAPLWRKISAASHKSCGACFIPDKFCSVCAFALFFIRHEKK
ncbi:hypothetical protein [Pararhizobium sp. PWRC1-1]|uniref:hypothetical protein n=1 Tax=Pararhizobium sp. PWRC1-1 TaxID=2804566 RepID=UPI003CE8441C